MQKKFTKNPGRRALRAHLIATSSVAAALASSGALAQQAGGLDTIVVTAEKRETGLQETPIAVTALTADAISQRGYTNTNDIANAVPNFTVTTAIASRSPSTPALFIRGVGQQDFIVSTDPGVGLYLDGVYIARTPGGVFDLLDIERIEVLRGPQGTLFGRNTIGGAVNIISRKPTDEFTGELSLTTGSFNRFDAKGFLSGPLSETVRAKLAASYQSRDGRGNRLDPATGQAVDSLGAIDHVSLKAGLTADLSENVIWDISADYARYRDEQLPSNMQFLDDPMAAPLLAFYNGLVAGPAGLPITSALNSPNRFDNFAAPGQQNRSDQDIWGVSSILTWDVGEATVKSISAYRALDSKISADGDGTPYPLLGNAIHNVDQWQFSQELQAYGDAFSGRLSWLAGVYYLHENAAETFSGLALGGLYNALEGLPGAVVPFPPLGSLGGAGNPLNLIFDISTLTNFEQDVDAYAAFFQTRYALTDRFGFTAGLRYSADKKDAMFVSANRLNSGLPILAPGTGLDETFDALTPKVGIDFQASDDLFLYASVTRGFKSGGLNGRLINGPGDFRPFDKETTLSYEAGFKSEFWDRRARLNVAGFYVNYDDIQIVVNGNSGGVPTAFTDNAGAGRAYGAEVEFTARPTEAFTFNANLGYIDTETTEVDQLASVPNGAPFQRTPEFSGNVSGAYTIPLSSTISATLFADFVFSSEYFLDTTLNESIREDGYGLLNLRLTLASDDGWEVAAFGTNITDEEYIVGGLDGVSAGLGTIERYFGNPREWGLSATLRF